jgi:hypothetical protein
VKWNWVGVALALVLGLPSMLGAGEAKIPNKTAARNKLVAWIQANDRHGPEGILRDILPLVDADMNQHNRLSVIMGAGATKSGKAFSLDVWVDTLFVTEFSDEQAAKLGARGNSASLVSSTKAMDQKLYPLPLKIGEVKIDRADSLPGDKRITGQLTLQVVGAVPANLAIRLSLSRKATTIGLLDYPDQRLPKEQGSVAFSFGPANLKGAQAVFGPQVAFVDVVQVVQRGNHADFTVCSNAVAILLEIEEPVSDA